jgi:hypothetical protein
MSARYSKTSSRGRSMLISSSMGSTTPAVLPLQTAHAHRAGVLRRAHELTRAWSLAAARPAELADDPLAVEIDALADQRRAMAVNAERALVRECSDTLAQERELESR